MDFFTILTSIGGAISSVISDIALINNFLLIAFYVVFAILVFRESNNPDSPIHWRDIIMDKAQNRVSLSKIGQFCGLVTSNWIMVFLVLQLDKVAIASILVWMFPMWLAYIGGTWSYTQWVKSKSSTPNDEEKKEQ